MHAVRIVLYMLIRAEDAVEMHETTLMGCETEGFCKLRPDGACDPPACGGFEPLTDPNPTLGGGQVRPDHPAGLSLLKHSTDPTNQAMPQQARTLAHHHLQADRDSYVRMSYVLRTEWNPRSIILTRHPASRHRN
jgi:hypothetical protein